MALVDAAVGNMIHYFNDNYSSLYGSIYGYDHLFMNWLWLFLVYILVCSLLYLGILIINKAGKKTIPLSGSLFWRYRVADHRIIPIWFFQQKTISTVIEFLTKAMGFMNDGRINYLFPTLTFLLLIAVFGSGSYAIIRRTELK